MNNLSILAASLLVTTLTFGSSDDGSSSGGSGGSGGSGAGGTGSAGSPSQGGGDNGGGGAGGAAASSFSEMCEARAASCGTDLTLCLAQEGCARDFLRDDIEESLVACLTAGCDEDACIGATSQEPVSSAGAAYQTACADKLTECANFADDVCSNAYLLSDEALAPFSECLALTDCAELDLCLSTAFEVFDSCESWI